MTPAMELAQAKLCPRCRDIKPLEHFHRDSSRKSGRCNYCKACQANYNQSYRDNNGEKRAAANARSYARHRQKRMAERAIYYAKNREATRAQQADYYIRRKAIRQFFKMHRAMHAIAETLNQMKP